MCLVTIPKEKKMLQKGEKDFGSLDWKIEGRLGEYSHRENTAECQEVGDKDKIQSGRSLRIMRSIY